MTDAKKIMIATPTADGLMTSGYAESLVAAIGAASEAGYGNVFVTMDNHDVAVTRNHLTAVALSREDISHILFIDNDMRIAKAVFARLISAGRPVVGGVYTKRTIDLETYAKARAEGHDEKKAKALASTFILRVGGGEVQVQEGLMKVEGIGLGACLIETAFLRRMAESGTIERMRALPEISAGVGDDSKVWNFFGRVDLGDGRLLSDDFSFCDRVIRVDPDALWAFVGPGMQHQGRYNYEGSFFERLSLIAKKGEAEQAEATTH